MARVTTMVAAVLGAGGGRGLRLCRARSVLLIVGILLMMMPARAVAEIIPLGNGADAAGDFDADGTTDITLYDTGTGTWTIWKSSTGFTTTVTYEWGVAGTDQPVPADYDGDGQADIAVYRPSTGQWFVRKSSASYSTTNILSFSWGISSDLPRPGYYDGDAKADITVVRPSGMYWYALKSGTTPAYDSAQAGVYVHGASGDQPVPADYDGDGKTDPAIFRPSTGQWIILKSTTSTTLTVSWGTANDTPVPGDYDGDGQSEIAIWRASNGYWYVLNSSSNYDPDEYWVQHHGDTGDAPVAGDYDGDGTSDLAIYRPPTEIAPGMLYVLGSEDGYAAYAVTPSVPLTIDRQGTGTGGVTGDFLVCTGGSGTQAVSCGASYNADVTVTLTAVPDSTSTFAGWGGACSGLGTCDVTMSVAQLVVAQFARMPDVDEVHYYHTDLIGSVRALTDGEGDTTIRHDYGPFGEDTQPLTGDPMRFAGKELDPETAYHYFGARYYRNIWGRFSSGDPIGGSLTDPQSWNRYTYARNNPLRFADPSGAACVATMDSYGHYGGGCDPAQVTGYERAWDFLNNYGICLREWLRCDELGYGDPNLPPDSADPTEPPSHSSGSSAPGAPSQPPPPVNPRSPEPEPEGPTNKGDDPEKGSDNCDAFCEMISGVAQRTKAVAHYSCSAVAVLHFSLNFAGPLGKVASVAIDLADPDMFAAGGIASEMYGQYAEADYAASGGDSRLGRLNSLKGRASFAGQTATRQRRTISEIGRLESLGRRAAVASTVGIAFNVAQLYQNVQHCG